MKPITPRTVPCAVCDRLVPHGRLMCSPHWHLVPKPQQVAVWRTWRAFGARKNATEGVGLLREYRQAADAAIEAVQARLQAQLPLQPSQSKEE